MELSESDILNEDKNQNAISLVPDEVISNSSSAEKTSKCSDSSKTSCTVTFVENVIKPQVIYVASASNPEGSPRQVQQKYEVKDRIEENCASRNPCTVSFTVDMLKPRVIYVTSALTSGSSPKQQGPHWSIQKFDTCNSNLSVVCEKTNVSQIHHETTTFSINAHTLSLEEEIRLQDVADSDDIFDDQLTEERQRKTINNFDDGSIKFCDVSVDENQTIGPQVKQNFFILKADIHTKQNINQDENETEVEKEKNLYTQSEIEAPSLNNSKTSTTILDETCCSVSVISNYNDNEIEITSNLSLDDCALEDSQINDTQIQKDKDNPVTLEIVSLDDDDQIHEPQIICVSSVSTINEHSAPNQLKKSSKIQTNIINHQTTEESLAKKSDKITPYSFTDQNMRYGSNNPIFSRIMFTISFFIRFIFLNCAKHSKMLIIGLILIITGLLLVGVGSIGYY